MKKLISIGVFVLSALFCQGQIILDSIQPQAARIVAFNITTLAHKLVPFNAQTIGLQNYAMQFRRKLNHGQTYFSSAFGFSMGDIAGVLEPLHFDLRLGFETQKQFTNKWFYGSGYNVVAFIHEIEESSFFSQDVEAGVGFSKSFLIGYNLNEHISLFTEAAFFFGITDNFNSSLVRLDFMAPTSLYLSVKF